jgi:hypothetical protein
MEHFIELHNSDNKPLILNTSHIVKIDETDTGTRICLSVPRIDSQSSSFFQVIIVRESYTTIKNMLI